MNMLNQKQKIIIGIIGIVAIFTIIFYIYQKIYRPNTMEYIDILEENIVEEKKTLQEEVSQEEIVIHIIGEVKKEGIVRLKQGSRIIDAIEQAGGLKEQANVNKVNLAYILEDGQKIYIPSIYDKTQEDTSYISIESGENVILEQADTTSQIGKININTATQTELEQLSGIGPSTALKIIQYRTESGKFNSIEEIKNVTGIGEAKYELIKEYITIK